MTLGVSLKLVIRHASPWSVSCPPLLFCPIGWVLVSLWNHWISWRSPNVDTPGEEL